jgi:hypothetical protein
MKTRLKLLVRISDVARLAECKQWQIRPLLLRGDVKAVALLESGSGNLQALYDAVTTPAVVKALLAARLRESGSRV